MPQVRMSEKAREEVRRLARRGWGAKRISDELKRLADLGELPTSDIREPRAVGRELAEWRSLPEDQKRRYEEVVWPTSFGRDGLPFEAAGAVLELARTIGRPPLISLAVWYWRSLLAFPGADVSTLRNIATQLALAEGDSMKQQLIGSAAIAGELGPLRDLGGFNPDSPQSVESAIHRIEIIQGALSPWMRQAFREVLDGSYRGLAEETNDGSSQG